MEQDKLDKLEIIYKTIKSDIEKELKVKLSWSYLWFHTYDEYSNSITVNPLTTLATDEQLLFRVEFIELALSHWSDTNIIEYLYQHIKQSIVVQWNEWIFNKEVNKYDRYK